MVDKETKIKFPETTHLEAEELEFNDSIYFMFNSFLILSYFLKLNIEMGNNQTNIA